MVKLCRRRRNASLLVSSYDASEGKCIHLAGVNLKAALTATDYLTRHASDRQHSLREMQRQWAQRYWLRVVVVAAVTYVTVASSPWVYSENAPIPAGTIRITTLGSGSPDVRKEQLASGFLLELGNRQQDKFLFDLGSGAFINLWATGVPLATVTKVFLTHLHSDHHADLATLYVGAMFGRKQPWEVWGPSGETPEFGTAAAIKGLRQFMAWDTHARRRIDLVGRKDDGDKVIAHEFDFSIENQVVYKRNGVTVTSTPVSHYNTSGPVAYRLDWQGLSITYSGDTRPVPALNKLAAGTDVLILQNMGPIKDVSELSYESQLLINTSHITPQQAGHIFTDVKPRLAVAHHLTVNAASRAAIIDDIRGGYPKGGLIINEDLNVYDISKKRIEVRRRLVPIRSWGYWHAESNWQSSMVMDGVLDDALSAA